MHSYQYNFDGDRETFHNWMTNMDLTCISSFHLGLFGSLYFVGYVIGTLTLLRLGDIIGRKPVVTATSAGLIGLFAAFIFVNNLYAVYVMLVLTGLLSITKGALSYMYMLEILPPNKRQNYHMYVMISDALGGIFI
jgi:MFS family permease